MPGHEISDDLLIKVTTACAEVEKLTGDRPHTATCHRWISRGIKGVRLQSKHVGGSRRTTKRWLREFFDGVTAAAEGRAVGPVSDANGTNAAERELESAGI